MSIVKLDVRPLNIQSELQIDNKFNAIKRIFHFSVSFEDPWFANFGNNDRPYIINSSFIRVSLTSPGVPIGIQNSSGGS